MTIHANVLITGATSGIGEALALYYAANGAENLFICGRDKTRLDDIKKRCCDLGAKVHANIIDVADSETMRKWIEKSNKIAALNLVIANAGVSTGEETEANVRNTVQTNVCGVVNTVLPVIELFKLRNDTNKHIAMLASIAGYHGLPTAPSYSASKAFVKAWGEAMRLSLKNEGIKVSVICPGFVRSRITDKNTCPMPFFMEAPRAAQIIARGIAKNKGIIAFPWPLRFSAWLMSCLPNVLSDLIYGNLPKKV
ncbi:MAG: SDR family NAD(P)-dependent oxidoreductase [Alphaproteobacteria bacterium]|nr:SDR family NAD(P)-dependent oxidoreductase [Alphaproteobacteria bacterium]